MPRHTSIGRTTAAAEAFARHRVVHTRVASGRFRVSGDEENIARVEVALGVLFGTLHGEWERIRCAGILLERDPDAVAPRPCVIFFAVDRIPGLSDAALARFGQCPAWFHRVESKQSRLFERIPEPAVDGPEVDEIIGVLSEGIRANTQALIKIVGRTPTMKYGFHTAATYEQANASFAEDGFEIVTRSTDATWARTSWPAALVRDAA